MEGATPATWEDPSLVQVWGPRYSVYVVADVDRALFTVGRLPTEPRARAVAEEAAARLAELLGDRRVANPSAAAADVNLNWFRHGASTGTFLLRWEGARAPTLWIVPRPDVDPLEARLELARRYLHVFGPTTAASFAEWAGISPRGGADAFERLVPELIPARTPLGDAWLLASDEAAARARPGKTAPARLLPSGDTFFLLQGADRELVLPDPGERARLWTSRVWPGAVLVGGEVAGTWRRAGGTVDVERFRPLTAGERNAVEAEAASLPLPALTSPIRVRWLD